VRYRVDDATMRTVLVMCSRPGPSPTLREIAHRTGRSLTAVQFVVEEMVRRGLLTRPAGTSRTLRPYVPFVDAREAMRS
jgi:predicted transcriptional regulator